ncbi:MAG: alpha/beta hydrolase [Acidimicrobiales bacterium]|jgi:pimeloyl-ACP methyl ester carboxylesterase
MASSQAKPSRLQPVDSFTVIDDMRFHCLEWGDRDNPTILFLHGGGLTAHTWDRICPSLVDSFYCVSLDQRGHGESDWSPTIDYSLDAHLKDIEGFVSAIGLERFLLVGMSMGAFNSLGYALNHSADLAGLVLIDIAPELRRDGIDRLHSFTNVPDVLPSVDAFVDRALSFNPQRDPEVLRNSLRYNLREVPGGGWTWRYDRRHRTSQNRETELEARAKLRLTLWGQAGTISCPTLVIRGADSDFTDGEELRGVVSQIPGWQFAEVANAGHTVQGDNPVGLLEVLTPFAEGLNFRADPINRGQ